MKITLVSPYHGGSHQNWAESYQTYSRHDVSLLTLPARFWKWRMHGGAVTLARRWQATDKPAPDLFLMTDMLDVTTFLALTRPLTAYTPIALYMHENQLTYPLPTNKATGPMRRQHGERDHHYVFINYASMLAADHVFFNSTYHRRTFLDALPRFLNHFPEYNERHTVEAIRAKSSVLPVGVDLHEARLATAAVSTNTNQPPLILWNQRWEYDKNPDAFFKALFAMQAQQIPFRLALCGQQYGKRPSIFNAALERLADHIIHVGHASRSRYRSLLQTANIVISTARHEFFGISIVEAIAHGAFPLLPRRLSYPEIVPISFHESCLYANETTLHERLRWALTHPQETAVVAKRLAPHMQRFGWQQMAPLYDNRLRMLVDASNPAS